MKRVSIYKAQPTDRTQPVESIEIVIDATLPEFFGSAGLLLSEVEAVYDKEATALCDALIRSLPQAVSERLLIKLLDARKCYFRMPAEQQKPKKVVCAIIRRGDEILMSRRYPNSAYGLMWEFPGGKVEDDDASLEAAIVREIREELGFEIRVVNEHHQRLFMTENNGLCDLHYFNCEVASGEPSAIQCLQFEWFKATNLAFRPSEKMPVDADLAFTIALEAVNLINAEKAAKGAGA